jgi:hypothetical protein
VRGKEGSGWEDAKIDIWACPGDEGISGIDRDTDHGSTKERNFKQEREREREREWERKRERERERAVERVRGGGDQSEGAVVAALTCWLVPFVLVRVRLLQCVER